MVAGPLDRALDLLRDYFRQELELPAVEAEKWAAEHPGFKYVPVDLMNMHTVSLQG